MIIQCRKCETRYRFDDALVEGEGVWVRCSRCQHVFFQEQPAAGEPLAPAASEASEIPSVRVSEARRMPGEETARTGERQPAAVDIREEGASFLSEEVNKEALSRFDKEPEIPVAGTAPEKDALRNASRAWDEQMKEEEESEEEEPRGWWGWMILKILALLVLVALIAGGIVFWYFPEIRTPVREWAYPWLEYLPGIEKRAAMDMKETKSPESHSVPVGIKDVRQRSVANLLVGNLRVIEGMAVNQSSFVQSRIRVRLVISDASDAVLGEKIVYCGNLLTDAELSTLADAEIQRELTIPQGSDVANEKIPPMGEIPFMIVFSQEHAGVIKITVTPAGVERVP